LSVTTEMLCERPFTLFLAPFLAAIPAVTLINHFLERRFARKWGQTWARMRGLDAGAPARPIRPAAGEAAA
jgi:hypothetical protein